MDVILQFWGKRDREAQGQGDTAYHPLLFHLLDVAAVAACLWDEVLGRQVRQSVSGRLGLSPEQTRGWLAFWAGLHDLGKATPAFQDKWPTAKQRLQDAGLPFPSIISDQPHGVLTAACLPDLLEHCCPGLAGEPADRLAVALGGHHGIFPRDADLQQVTRASVGGQKWWQARRDLCRALAACCGVQNLQWPGAPALDHAFFLFMAGLVSVADWIGSNAVYFPFAPPDTAPESYFQETRIRAKRALQTLGWLGWQAPTAVANMTELFPFLGQSGLRPLQAQVTELAPQLTEPGLVIVEAPMGEGKTEAALFLADTWAALLGQRGCYVALPTMATSNQMFGRVKEFLAHRYPTELVNLHLLHGHASLSAEFQVLRQQADRLFAPTAIASEGEAHGQEPDLSGAVLAAEWFTHRKRGLLAPFGVGTIDQALLAVLSTRHFFVRLFGLAYKTVVIDEVHAYDAYMVKLLECLLAWLAALGGSVVLLSATLPAARRQALLAAYATGLGRPDLAQDLPGSPYPRLSWVSTQGAGTRHFSASPQLTRSLSLSWVEAGDSSPATLAAVLGPRLQEALAQGGCAAVICNTVGRAQEVYAGLKPFFPAADAGDGWPELDLLHARYPFADREARELRALTRFGKPGGRVAGGDGSIRDVQRPQRAVLVATQIIEQSLDLDFDLMISDLAPVDLLLQRSGRLHRHDRRRPAPLSQPTLWLLAPPVLHGVPEFDAGTANVYDRHILLRSWLALRERTTVAIPQELEELIEAVYGELPPPPLPPALLEVWETTQQELARNRREEEFQARTRYIRPPDNPDDLLQASSIELAEEQPELHPSLQAATRLAGPTVPVILLYERHGILYDTLAGDECVDILSQPPPAVITRLLRRSVTLTHPGLVHRLLQQGEIPPAWRRQALLCRHRLLRLDQQDCWRDDGYEVRLDAELGLLIHRFAKEGP